MKICYLAHGQSIHTQRWVRYFSAQGHEVHLISFQPFADDKTVFHVLKRKFPVEDLDYFLQISTVRRLVREIQPDILHAHYLTSFGFLGACSGWHPFVVTALGSDILITPFRSFLHKMLTRFVLKKADLAIADAQISTSKMIELGAGKEKVITLPCGIDPRLFYPRPKIDDQPVLISVRHHKPLFNLGTIMKAVVILRNQKRDVKLLLAGDGPLRPKLEALAKRLEVRNFVEFLGEIPHEKLGELYRQASIYLAIPCSDATSISLLEAMACGIFPIVSDIPANREWVTDGLNGILIPFDNPTVLAEKIVQALDDRNLRKRAAKINQEIIKEKALWGKNMEMAERYYLQLLPK